MPCVLFVDVEQCRLTMRRHHWHCWLCSYCHNIISSGSPPYSLNALVIGASLSEPNIDHDNGPCAWNNGIRIIYPVFVAPWFLRSVYALKCSVYSGTYIDMLTCVIYNCMHLTAVLTDQQGRLELLMSAVIFIDKDR